MRARRQDVPAELQAVWRLASGVANDFNNILQVIGGNAETVLQTMEGTDPNRTAVQAIADASKRASTLTHQLLAYGRRQALSAHPLDLSAIVCEALPQLRRVVHTEIQVSAQLAARLPAVHADRAHLLEVLSHLAGHAADAMPEGGTLRFATDVLHVGAQMRQLRPWLPAGRFVRLEMADSGDGLDPQEAAHLFEPFHTTKSRCGGGLGLSAAYGLVKQMGGYIWVDSERGQGTRITVLLPASSARRPLELLPPTPRRVLLVEDDDDVRALLDSILMHHGFSVASYGTAEDALADSAPFDVLITDIVLPGQHGGDLAREFKRRRPGVPVLFMSGDAGNVADLEGLKPHAFLQKPFGTAAFVENIEELLSI
ncbi:MAG: ATP-binding protein [Vicinamibacterales bacterium]